MPNFMYDNNVPFVDNNPSDDQPEMLQNTQSINSIIDEDHFSFNQAQGGLHKKSRYFNNLQTAFPTGIAQGVGTQYSNYLATSAGTNESQLMYTPDDTTDVYQLTRTISTEIAKFGTNAAYPALSTTQVGGWTFLPGGLLLQYGNYTNAFLANVPQLVQFPIAFTTQVYSLQVIANNVNPGSISVRVIAPPGLTSFQIRTTVNETTGFYWMAIGL